MKKNYVKRKEKGFVGNRKRGVGEGKKEGEEGGDFEKLRKRRMG